MQNKKELWTRLQNYHFDHLVPPSLMSHVAQVFGGPDASTKAFASKLSRKLGWKTDFAMRAIHEYKKFVYLGVSGPAVTPSKVIDQVWHEHLLFTDGYAKFCHDILGTTFHHHPELIPIGDQTDVFRAQYAATVARYEEEFNAEPPDDIWSVAKFAGDTPVREPFVPKPKPKGTFFDSGDDSAPLWMFFDGTGTADPNHHNHHRHGHSSGDDAGWVTGGGHSHSHSHGDHGGHGAEGSFGGDSGHGGHGDSGSGAGGDSGGGGDSGSGSSCGSSSCSSSGCSGGGGD